MVQGMAIQKDAVACGYWPLYSFDPRNEAHPFQLASKKPEGAFKDFALKEARFRILERAKPEASAQASRPRPAGHLQALSILRAVGRSEPRKPATAAAEKAEKDNGETMAKDSKEVGA